MTVDLHKVRQKLQYIRYQARELERFRSMDESTFAGGDLHALAAARMVQVALDAAFDLCAHIIAHEGWGLPKSYREIVLLALERGLLPPKLRDSYLQMARFRNRLVHLYDPVEDHELLQFIKDHLDDFAPLVVTVVRTYLPAPAGG
jgi:uncharacterized protein YutE (UPF0331/DUF86 family)